MRRRLSTMFSGRGGISVLVLVFGVVVSVAVGGMVTVAATQYSGAVRTEAFEKSLEIAQAGVEYYRWHLAHNPSDYTDGTGGPGPYVHPVTDPYGNTAGTYSLTITPPSSGSSQIVVSSKGWLNSYPGITRSVTVKYGIPSLARFAFLQNANVWFGGRTTVHGKVFSNGGIRMDGTNESLVQSAKATYTCGSETGCSPAQTKPGVWGSGGPTNLWEFPVTPIDFNGIALDFAKMKDAAGGSGIFLPRVKSHGYHLVFTPDGKVTITRVNNTTAFRGWSVEKGCELLYQKVKTELPVGTYDLAGKQVIFSENDVWVEGTVNGRVTVVAAVLPIDQFANNIWVNNNLVYASHDGSVALGLIAENDIYFGLDIPQDFTVEAALLAHRGKIIRHNYKYQSCNINAAGAVKQSLTIYGVVISGLKSYWSYGSGPNVGYGSEPTSGFRVVNVTQDLNLYTNPPPYFPSQGEPELISWEER